jgi:hypothetical protein
LHDPVSFVAFFPLVTSTFHVDVVRGLYLYDEQGAGYFDTWHGSRVPVDLDCPGDSRCSGMDPLDQASPD